MEAIQLTGSLGTKQRKEREHMDNEVRPTWRLAWGLWWRMTLISLGVFAIIWLVLFAVGEVLAPL